MLRRMVLAAVAAVALGATSQPVQASIIGDFVLVLDESSSINATEFQQERQFARDFVNSLPFGQSTFSPGQFDVFAGLAMFGTVARQVRQLDGNEVALINAINQVQQQGGSTNYSLAIDLGVSMLTAPHLATRTVPKVMIFLSDGADLADPMLTDASIAAMNAANVITFSIGVRIGNCQACVDRLIDVANDDPTHFFLVNDFAGLSGILNPLLMAAMQATTPQPQTDVAEPAMLALFSLGLVGLGCAARSRRTRAAA
jgi:hypothetical protein